MMSLKKMLISWNNVRSLRYFSFNFSVCLMIMLLGQLAMAFGESEFAETARLRRYPGGADEGDLRVQTQLVVSPKAKENEFTQDNNEGF